jgi:peptide/nickel transport system substrate-binding protein
MKRLRWPFLIVLVALVAIALLLRNQQSPILQPAVAPAQPASGGVYTEALVGAPGRLNPVLDYYNPADRDVDRLIYSGLIRFDDRGVPQADLAESWGVSQDGKTYNFAIRPDAKWHDGEPVTTDDVLFTVDLLRQDSSSIPDDLRQFWNDVEVTAFDEHSLQFRLPEAFAPFLDYLTFGVLPKHLLESVPAGELADAEFNLAPVGSGPYRFSRFLTEDGQIKGVVLSAFEDYYFDRPFIDEVVFRYFPDASSALAAYQSGEVTGVSVIPTEILPQALKEPDLKLYTGRQPRLTLAYMNLGDPQLPFFQDANIRRALLMGLNRQGMVDQILSGQALVADGPILPGTWAYYDGLSREEYDPEGAIRLIEEAGYNLPASGEGPREKEGVRLAFELAHPDDAQSTAIAEAMKRDWERLGVEVTLKAMPFEQLLSDALEPRSYQAALVDLNLSRFPDPDPYPFWDQAQITGGQNYAKWDDRQASEYLEQARVTVDLGERAKAYKNFQVRFAQETPALTLFYPVYSYGVDQQVQGVRMGPLFDTSDRFATLPQWYLISKRPAEATPTPSPTP